MFSNFFFFLSLGKCPKVTLSAECKEMKVKEASVE